MYDRPNITELLHAVRTHLEDQVIPTINSERKLYYQTLVAINVLRIVERELQTGQEPLRQEWQRLNFVQGITTPFPEDEATGRATLAERNRRLCEEISAGRYDYMPQRAALFEHLMFTARAQLEIANPRFLQMLAEEDEKNAP